MKVLIAPDKFKGSLTAKAVCDALSLGLHASNPTITIITKPLADGGDGSLEVLKHYLPLQTRQLTVHDPLMRPIQACYTVAGETAYIEMATASGLVLLKTSDRNCMETTSYGTGELIADAIQKGAKQIYLFIGGSATNDGGIGIAKALGYEFYDKDGQSLAPIGKNLSHIQQINKEKLSFNLQEIAIKVVCDVSNPFFGKNGAAYVYAPQKGASSEEVVHLDNGLRHLSDLLSKQNYPNIANLSGAGAAGGIGGGAVAFLEANLVSGIELFLDITDLETDLKDCDYVITGEGKIDSQSLQGKVVGGVTELARKHAIPVVAVCGAADIASSQSLGIQQIFTVLERSASLEEAMNTAGEKLQKIGREIGLGIRK